MTTFICILAWLLVGYINVGFYNAYSIARYAMIADKSYWNNIVFSCAVLVFGPAGCMGHLIFGMYRCGWKAFIRLDEAKEIARKERIRFFGHP